MFPPTSATSKADPDRAVGLKCRAFGQSAALFDPRLTNAPEGPAPAWGQPLEVMAASSA